MTYNNIMDGGIHIIPQKVINFTLTMENASLFNQTDYTNNSIGGEKFLIEANKVNSMIDYIRTDYSNIRFYDSNSQILLRHKFIDKGGIKFFMVEIPHNIIQSSSYANFKKTISLHILIMNKNDSYSYNGETGIFTSYYDLNDGKTNGVVGAGSLTNNGEVSVVRATASGGNGFLVNQLPYRDIVAIENADYSGIRFIRGFSTGVPNRHEVPMNGYSYGTDIGTPSIWMNGENTNGTPVAGSSFTAVNLTWKITRILTNGNFTRYYENYPNNTCFRNANFVNASYYSTDKWGGGRIDTAIVLAMQNPYAAKDGQITLSAFTEDMDYIPLPPPPYQLPPDYSELEDLYWNEAHDKTDIGYTINSWTNFTINRTNAYNMLLNQTAENHQQVLNMVNSLKNSIDELLLIADIPNYENLQILIDTIHQINSNLYINGWDELINLTNEAQNMIDTNSANNQQQVLDMMQSLQEAVNNLEEKYIPPTEKPITENPIIESPEDTNPLNSSPITGINYQWTKIGEEYIYAFNGTTESLNIKLLFNDIDIDIEKVRGIALQFDRLKQNGSDKKDSIIRIDKGNQHGENKAKSEIYQNNIWETVYYGSKNDLWGLELNNLKDLSFRFNCKGQNEENNTIITLRNIKLIIYYEDITANIYEDYPMFSKYKQTNADKFYHQIKNKDGEKIWIKEQYRESYVKMRIDMKEELPEKINVHTAQKYTQSSTKTQKQHWLGMTSKSPTNEMILGITDGLDEFNTVSNKFDEKTERIVKNNNRIDNKKGLIAEHDLDTMIGIILKYQKYDLITVSKAGTIKRNKDE